LGLREKARVGKLTLLGRRDPLDTELREVARRVLALAPTGTGSRRVYLSRGNATRRRLTNEVDVVAVLERHGFEPVKIDGSDPAEQIRVVRDADHLVGLHGAELTNLMFLRPGARMLELRHPNQLFNDAYVRLAAQMGVRYGDFRCSFAPGSITDGWDVNFADLVADPGRLDAELNRWAD
jgi:capsular polysaccharide biosynthesis protein